MQNEEVSPLYGNLRVTSKFYFYVQSLSVDLIQIAFVKPCLFEKLSSMAGPYIGYILTTHAEKEARMLSRRQIRDACNPFELPDNEFRRIYRMSKDMGLYICGELENQLQPKRRDGLPVHIKVDLIYAFILTVFEIN